MTHHQHSEGPWQLIDGVIRCKDGEPPFSPLRSPAENTANTHLITAAPELLAACKEAYTAIDGYIELAPEEQVSDSEKALHHQLRTVIIKATQIRQKEKS